MREENKREPKDKTPHELYGVFPMFSVFLRRACALLATGHTNREIAEKMNTTEQNVKNYLGAAYKTLAIKDRTKLAIFIVRRPKLEAYLRSFLVTKENGERENDEQETD